MAESEEELKPLDESERGEWKSWLKNQHSKNEDHGIWSHHFMANRWGNWKQWQILFSWAQKSLWMVTAAMKLKDACSLETKLWKTWQCIKKQRHYFANKVSSSQSYGFSNSHVWMSELDYKESWMPKNWCFLTVVLEKTLESPWTANQSILKDINPEYSLEGLMLKLKLQSLATWCKELTHWKRPWCWKRLRAGGKGYNRGWDCWIASLIQWTWVWANSGRWWRTGKPGVMQSMGLQRVEHNWATE